MHYYMFYKPRGLLTARTDANRPTIMTCFPPELQTLLHPVGRLDMDTEGLLLLTDDGKLDQHLLRPEHGIEKEYLFEAFGHLETDAVDTLARGVTLPCGAKTKGAQLQLLGYCTRQDCARRIAPADRSRYLKNPQRPVTRGRIRITEGKRHEVRLMIRAVDGFVFWLKRISIGPLTLDEALKPGQYRPLTPEELEMLWNAGQCGS